MSESVNLAGQKKIMIVEDDEVMLKLVERILSKEGYSIEIANNGKEAIEKLTHNHFDLVITDVMMPYANGFEIISRIKSSQNGAQTAVIIISSLNNEDSIMEGFELGANDFLRKPIMIGELMIRVKRLLRN